MLRAVSLSPDEDLGLELVDGIAVPQHERDRAVSSRGETNAQLAGGSRVSATNQPGTVGRLSRPSMRAIAVRANRWNVTIALVGFPGRPKKYFFRMLPLQEPNTIGFPG